MQVKKSIASKVFTALSLEPRAFYMPAPQMPQEYEAASPQKQKLASQRLITTRDNYKDLERISPKAFQALSSIFSKHEITKILTAVVNNDFTKDDYLNVREAEQELKSFINSNKFTRIDPQAKVIIQHLLSRDLRELGESIIIHHQLKDILREIKSGNDTSTSKGLTQAGIRSTQKTAQVLANYLSKLELKHQVQKPEEKSQEEITQESAKQKQEATTEESKAEEQVSQAPMIEESNKEDVQETVTAKVKEQVNQAPSAEARSKENAKQKQETVTEYAKEQIIQKANAILKKTQTNTNGLQYLLGDPTQEPRMSDMPSSSSRARAANTIIAQSRLQGNFYRTGRYSYRGEERKLIKEAASDTRAISSETSVDQLKHANNNDFLYNEILRIPGTTAVDIEYEDGIAKKYKLVPAQYRLGSFGSIKTRRKLPELPEIYQLRREIIDLGAEEALANYFEEFLYIRSSEIQEIIDLLPKDLSSSYKTALLGFGNCHSLSDHAAHVLQGDLLCEVNTGIADANGNGILNINNGHAVFVYKDELENIRIFETTAATGESYTNLKLKAEHKKELVDLAKASNELAGEEREEQIMLIGAKLKAFLIEDNKHYAQYKSSENLANTGNQVIQANGEILSLDKEQKLSKARYYYAAFCNILDQLTQHSRNTIDKEKASIIKPTLYSALFKSQGYNDLEGTGKLLSSLSRKLHQNTLTVSQFIKEILNFDSYLDPEIIFAKDIYDYHDNIDDSLDLAPRIINDFLYNYNVERSSRYKFKVSPKIVDSSGTSTFLNSSQRGDAEFAEFRQLQAGEDAKLIDWKTSARTGRLVARSSKGNYLDPNKVETRVVIDLPSLFSCTFRVYQLAKLVALIIDSRNKISSIDLYGWGQKAKSIKVEKIDKARSAEAKLKACRTLIDTIIKYSRDTLNCYNSNSRLNDSTVAPMLRDYTDGSLKLSTLNLKKQGKGEVIVLGNFRKVKEDHQISQMIRNRDWKLDTAAGRAMYPKKRL